MSADDPLREIGRGLAQVHLKLSRIEQKLDSAPGDSAPARPTALDGDLDILLDLVDAVESALERRPLSPRGLRGWLRGGGSAKAEDLWRGLAVAVSGVRERLERAGIEPAPQEGAFDPKVHQAVDVVPIGSGGGVAGTLAATHRRGWLRRQGAERKVLRTAQVSVHGEAP